MAKSLLKKPSVRYEDYIKIKLDFITTALSDIRIAISNHHEEMKLARDAIQNNVTSVGVKTDSLEKTMILLPNYISQTNALLATMNENFLAEFKQARLDLKESNKESGDKVKVKTVFYFCVFALLIIAINQGITFEGFGTKFSKPIVEQLKENNQAADMRKEKPQKVTVDQIPLPVEDVTKDK